MQQINDATLVLRIALNVVIEGKIEAVDDDFGHIRLERADRRNDWRRTNLQIVDQQPHQRVIAQTTMTVAVVDFHPGLDDQEQEIDAIVERHQMGQNRRVDRSDAIEEVQMARIGGLQMRAFQDWRMRCGVHHQIRKTSRIIQKTCDLVKYLEVIFTFRLWRQIDVEFQTRIWKDNDDDDENETNELRIRIRN